MNNLIKILLLVTLLSLVSARTSGRHISYDPMDPVGTKTNDTAKEFKATIIEDDEDSLKWKRRHKRRKKGRKSKRGR